MIYKYIIVYIEKILKKTFKIILKNNYNFL